MRVYVAGPYTKPDPEANTLQALKVADTLLAMGHTPFVPHLYHYWEAFSPKPYEIWTGLDMQWLEQCEAVFLITGDSPGAEAEVARAKELGIPIYTNLKMERIDDGNSNS
jgi:hypothetical protein